MSGSLVPLVPIRAEAALSWPLLAGETLETEVQLTRDVLPAPVKAGEQVGVLRGYVDGALVGEVPLLCGASSDCNVAGPRTLFGRVLDLLFQ